MKKSIKVNALLNSIRSILYILFPLISLPYATRVLGVENIGKVNYVSSIISYFSLLAALGISTYAVREGAKVREERKQFQKFANEVFTINLLSTFFTYIILICFVLLVPKIENYKLLIFLQSLSIILTTFGVDWVNVIYEDYVFITIRGIIAQCISIILLFLLVKNESDYYIYAAITVITNAFISISNHIHCKMYCNIKPTLHFNLKTHIKPMLVFFANAVTVSIYVNSDITMLGWIYGDYVVGLYTVVVKVYSMVKTIIVALYNTTISRLTFYISNNKEAAYYDLLQKILKALLLLLMPSIMGVILLSRDIVFVLAGDEFLESVLTLRILAVGIFFAVIGGYITSCVNIPSGYEVVSLKASVLSAISNVLFNIFMIPMWQQNGAAITTVVAEAIICIFCILKSPVIKKINFRGMFKSYRDSIVGMILVVFIYVCMSSIENMFLHLIAVFLGSVIVYLSYLIIVRNEFVYPTVIRKIRRVRR